MILLNAWASCAPSLTCLKMLESMFPRRAPKQLALSPEKRKLFEDKISSIAHKMGIKKPIHLVETTASATPFATFGSQSIFLKMGVVVDPEAIKKMGFTDDECEFILAHELAHLKANDNSRLTAIRILASVVSTIALGILFPGSLLSGCSTLVTISVGLVCGPVSQASMVGFTTGVLVMLFTGRKAEKAADITALNYCSDAAKTAASSTFQKMVDHLLKERNNSAHSPFKQRLLKWIISPEGNHRLDIMHPSLTERIKYLRRLTLQSA